MKKIKKYLKSILCLAIILIIITDCSNTSKNEDSIQTLPSKFEIQEINFLNQENSPCNKISKANTDCQSNFSVHYLPIIQDGISQSGSLNTIELETNWVDFDSNCPHGIGHWCASVILRHFASQELPNTFIQITNISQSGFSATNSYPSQFGLNNQNGLWFYGSLLPGQGGYRTWEFPDNKQTYPDMQIVAGYVTVSNQ